MTSRIRTIVIVGGGFSGTVLAADLLRAPGARSTRVVLIERRHELGRGVAYEKGDFPFVLNVPAGRMSADPDKPLDFAHFAARRHPELAGQAFLPRELYGDYLQDFLARAQADAAPTVELRRIEASAERIVRLERSGRLVVQLSDREQLIADDVILACGDPPPVLPVALRAFEADERVVRDPYRAQIPFAKLKSVLLVGSGLTMCDFAVAAASLNPEIRIHVLSRHGLMPMAQSTVPPAVLDADLSAALVRAEPRVRVLFTAFRDVLRRTLSRGGDWRDAIGMVRAAAPGIWQRLPIEERARFVRHVRPYWDVHRHRVPAATAHLIRRLKSAGQFQLHAGRLLDVKSVRKDASSDRLQVRFAARGCGELRELVVDKIVNCTGAYGRIAATEDPLLRDLLRSGLASADASGLGLNLGANGALVDSDGRTSRNLHYVGPMLRASRWEATAAGELRSETAKLAGFLRQTDHSGARDGLREVARLRI